VYYDPMLAKLIAWAPDREGAFARLRAALESTEVDGVRTNARFLWEILGAERVLAGDVSTRLLEEELQPGSGPPAAEVTDAWHIAAAVVVQGLPGDAAGAALAAESPWRAATGFRLNGPPAIRVALRLGGEARWVRVTREPGGLAVSLADRAHHVSIRPATGGSFAGTIDGRPVSARVEIDHEQYVVRRMCLRFEFHLDTGAEHRASAEHEGHFRAPMPGHVLDVRVAQGQRVAAGAVLVVLEAMKMEHSLLAPWGGRVAALHVKPGDRVEEGADLVQLEPWPED
jgi:3-methylcrotonyl-CoA carboxylase alpha subunit